MATVRIYKVAELLNTTSQEVIALLKRDHGIEVKSASSTIEEVVAREFVVADGAPARPQRPVERVVRRHAGAGQGKEAGRQGAGAGQAGCPGAAAAATGQDREAVLSPPEISAGRRRLPKPCWCRAAPPVHRRAGSRADAPVRRPAATAVSRSAAGTAAGAVEEPAASPRQAPRARRRVEPRRAAAAPRGRGRGAATPPRLVRSAADRPHRAADDRGCGSRIRAPARRRRRRRAVRCWCVRRCRSAAAPQAPTGNLSRPAGARPGAPGACRPRRCSARRPGLPPAGSDGRTASAAVAAGPSGAAAASGHVARLPSAATAAGAASRGPVAPRRPASADDAAGAGRRRRRSRARSRSPKA